MQVKKRLLLEYSQKRRSWVVSSFEELNFFSERAIITPPYGLQVRYARYVNDLVKMTVVSGMDSVWTLPKWMPPQVKVQQVDADIQM